MATINLNDNIHTDTSTINAVDFLTIQDEITVSTPSTSLLDETTSFFNEILTLSTQLEDMLKESMDIFNSLATLDLAKLSKDMFALLDGVLSNLGIPLALRSFIMNVLKELCYGNNKNRNLTFSMLDNLLFSISIKNSFCTGKGVSFSTLMDAMFNASGFQDVKDNYQRVENLLRQLPRIVQSFELVKTRDGYGLSINASATVGGYAAVTLARDNLDNANIKNTILEDSIREALRASELVTASLPAIKNPTILDADGKELNDIDALHTALLNSRIEVATLKALWETEITNTNDVALQTLLTNFNKAKEDLDNLEYEKILLEEELSRTIAIHRLKVKEVYKDVGAIAITTLNLVSTDEKTLDANESITMLNEIFTNIASNGLTDTIKQLGVDISTPILARIKQTSSPIRDSISIGGRTQSPNIGSNFVNVHPEIGVGSTLPTPTNQLGATSNSGADSGTNALDGNVSNIGMGSGGVNSPAIDVTSTAGAITATVGIDISMSTTIFTNTHPNDIFNPEIYDINIGKDILSTYGNLNIGTNIYTEDVPDISEYTLGTPNKLRKHEDLFTFNVVRPIGNLNIDRESLTVLINTLLKYSNGMDISSTYGMSLNRNISLHDIPSGFHTANTVLASETPSIAHFLI